MYNVSQPWPNSGSRKPLPLGRLRPVSWLKSTTDGLKIQEMARNVSGIMDRIASVVAKLVPKRIPRIAGMARRIRPTIEMASVQ